MMDRDTLKRFIERHEGRRATAYADSRNIPTIGVGFNLTRPDARAKLAGLGLDYEAVCGKRVALTDAQIDQLLEPDITDAIDNARRCVSNFDRLPSDVQMVVVDMVFNLGLAGYANFKKMIAALEREDWAAAAREMEDSVWYGQVKRRASEDVALVRGARAGLPPTATA